MHDPIPLPLAKRITMLAIALAVVVGLIGARTEFLGYQSGDYVAFLSPWFDSISSAPWRSALAHTGANYFPPYLYLIFIMTRLPIAKYIALKLIAIAGDALLGGAIYSVARACGRSLREALMWTALVLALPTVIFDAAMWGQTDAIYCALLLFALSACLRGRGFAAANFFASAFAFKMQALFFAPVLALFVVFGAVRLYQLAIIPVVHFLWMLPSFVLGAGWQDSYGMFATQANYYHALQNNAPSLYQFIPQVAYEMQSPAGVFIALALIGLALLYACEITPAPLRAEIAIAWSSFFLIFMPFLLPKMHDRYFFVSNVASVVCALKVQRWQTYVAALLCNLASLFAYAPFLFRRTPVPLEVAAMGMLIACALTFWVARELAFAAEGNRQR